MWRYYYDRIWHKTVQCCFLHIFSLTVAGKTLLRRPVLCEPMLRLRLYVCVWAESELGGVSLMIPSALFPQRCVFIESMEGRLVSVVLSLCRAFLSACVVLPWGCSAAPFHNKIMFQKSWILGSETWLCNKAASAGSHLSHVVTFLDCLCNIIIMISESVPGGVSHGVNDICVCP